jgi:ATP-binding cassette subfamily E protein 1
MLHRLPIPRLGKILGLVGPNRVGKSTVLKILAGALLPNFGSCECSHAWKDILKSFSGSDQRGYFTKLVENNMKAIIKV